jgi:hypothetical protein
MHSPFSEASFARTYSSAKRPVGYERLQHDIEQRS